MQEWTRVDELWNEADNVRFYNWWPLGANDASWWLGFGNFIEQWTLAKILNQDAVPVRLSIVFGPLPDEMRLRAMVNRIKRRYLAATYDSSYKLCRDRLLGAILDCFCARESRSREIPLFLPEPALIRAAPRIVQHGGHRFVSSAPL